MNNFNFTVIEGNLVDDPYDGSFTIVSTERQTDIDGRQVNAEVSFDVHTTGKLADVVQKYLKKGARVLVSGKLANDGSAFYLDGKEVNFLSPAGA